jgi:hypothetical protein
LIGDYIGIPSFYINECPPERIVQLLEDMLIHRSQEKERLLALRENSAGRYRESIAGSLPEFIEDSGKSWPSKSEKTSAQKLLSLASVAELSSRLFCDFMLTLNTFARRWGLRQFTNWSKIWEYPWLWFNGLSGINWSRAKVLDIGSELGPMPWFLASIGRKSCS